MPECWGGFEPSATYATTRPLFYWRWKLADHFFWDGSAPGNGKRVSLDEYRRRPSSYPGVKLIPEGTAIQARQVQYRTNIEYSHLEILGVMLDGPLEGVPVDFRHLATFPAKREVSCGKFRVYHYEPNPALIRMVRSGQGGG